MCNLIGNFDYGIEYFSGKHIVLPMHLWKIYAQPQDPQYILCRTLEECSHMAPHHLRVMHLYIFGRYHLWGGNTST